MPEVGIRHALSQCPFQIVMYDGSGLLSSGTAFFYEHENECFLITNWHNFGRKIPGGGTSSPSRLPDNLKVKFFTLFAEGTRMTAVAQRIELYDADGPRWYEHPDHGPEWDVVALPLARPESCPNHFHMPANQVAATKVPIEPGVTVFVVGFPKAISVGKGLPLWKSGYIASEPYFDVTIGGEISDVGGLAGGQTIPAFFIDSQTRPGMSGSPVFACFTGTWDTTNPYKSPEVADLRQRPDDIILAGTATQFVGCYSGRVGSSEHQAALGLCWRADVIEDICAAKVRAQNPR